jgi:hypothetical protein
VYFFIDFLLVFFFFFGTETPDVVETEGAELVVAQGAEAKPSASGVALVFFTSNVSTFRRSSDKCCNDLGAFVGATVGNARFRFREI